MVIFLTSSFFVTFCLLLSFYYVVFIVIVICVIMSTGPPGSRCLFCGLSTATRMGGRRPRPQLRSYELTEEYLTDNPHVQVYSLHRLDAREITPSDRICRPCVQRANRYYTREQQRLARIADAVSIMNEPSSDESAEGPVSDPLRGVSPPIPQGVPDEVPIRSPDEVLMEVSDEVLEEDVPQDELQGAANPHGLRIPVPGLTRVSYTSSFCVVAQCNVHDGLHRINVAIRADVLRKKNIYIPAAVRVCNEHLNSNVIWQDFEDYTRPRHELYNSEQVADMVKLLQKPIDFLDFEKLETIDETTFQYFIGFSKTDFFSILDNTPSLQQLKQPKRALAMVLSKLHTGDSNDRLSSLFRISPAHFGRVMKKVRTHLLNEFVPLHLGLSRNRETEEYREELRQRMLSIPKLLYGSPEQPNRVITICDGTYLWSH